MQNLFTLCFVVFLQCPASTNLGSVSPWPSVRCFPLDPSDSCLGMKYQLEEHLSPSGIGLRSPEPEQTRGSHKRVA